MISLFQLLVTALDNLEREAPETLSANQRRAIRWYLRPQIKAMTHSKAREETQK